MSVLVIGAGISGLSTAIQIQQLEPRAKVTLVAAAFSDCTTSAIAAGHWQPAYLADQRVDHIKHWASVTYDYLAQLYHEDPEGYAVGRVSGYNLHYAVQDDPFWADCVPDFRRLSTRELENLGWGMFRDGFFFTSYYLECKRHLPFLLKRCTSAVYKFNDDLNVNLCNSTADVIVNCSGLGSYNLVGDKSCFPIRGQVFKVRAPFIKHFVIADDTYYILPNHDIVTLGGTHQEGDWRTELDKKDSEDIWEGTSRIWPSIKSSTILGEYVGLRPGRPMIRVETEMVTLNRRTVPVVHNYGHGGSGITLHRGCAIAAADMTKEALHKRSRL